MNLIKHPFERGKKRAGRCTVFYRFVLFPLIIIMGIGPVDLYPENRPDPEARGLMTALKGIRMTPADLSYPKDFLGLGENALPSLNHLLENPLACGAWARETIALLTPGNEPERFVSWILSRDEAMESPHEKDAARRHIGAPGNEPGMADDSDSSEKPLSSRIKRLHPLFQKPDGSVSKPGGIKGSSERPVPPSCPARTGRRKNYWSVSPEP